MKEEEKMAYVAGLMDGDGSFSIIKEKARGNSTSPLYYPLIQLAKGSEWLIDYLISNFGGRENVRQPYRAKDGKMRKINYAWKIRNREVCQSFIEKIIPYLVIKKERAEYLSTFISEDKTIPGSNKVSDEVTAQREECHLKMKEYNACRALHIPITDKAAKVDTQDPSFWAYLSGIMDTDGSFTLTRRNNHTNMVSSCYTPLIQISSVNIRSLNFILENFTGGKVKLRKGINCKTGFCYKYILTNITEISNFCRNLIPFLNLKKRQAEILLQFCEKRSKVKFCRGGIPQDEIEFREKCRIEIMQLNMGSINLT